MIPYDAWGLSGDGERLVPELALGGLRWEGRNDTPGGLGFVCSLDLFRLCFQKAVLSVV